MTTILTLALLLSATPATEEPARHPWPFAPATQAHEISNHFCAPLRLGEVSGYLHGGIDIRKPAGTPVLAVATGTVWIYREKHLDNLVLTEPNGDSWEYRHLFADRIPPAVRLAHERGLLVEAGTVIGEVAPWGLDYSHLHFNHRKSDGTIVDPLSVLIPLPDATPPVIEAVHIFPVDRTTPYPREEDGRVIVAGRIDVVATASDRIAVERWKHPPRRAWADLIDQTGKETRIATWQPFDHTLPLAPRLPVPRYPRGPGLAGYLRFGPLATDNPIPMPRAQRFSIVVTDRPTVGDELGGVERERAWDTRDVPDGRYTLRVGVEDAARLSARTTIEIEVRNANPPPLPPRSMPTELETSLAAHGFATCYAGDRVEHVFRVPREWCDGEWSLSPGTEIVEVTAGESHSTVRVCVETEGLSGTRSFFARTPAMKVRPLELEVEIHPLFEIAPNPRLRRTSAGDYFLKVRFRTPESSSCHEMKWVNGDASGSLRVTRHGLGAPTVHCMTIEATMPESALGGSLECTLESLGRFGKVVVPIPSEVTSEAL